MDANTTNISLSDFDKICRVCLDKNEHLRPLNELNEQIVEIFQNATQIELNDHDNLPRKLCTNCVLKLKLLCLFVLQSRESDITLKSFVVNYDHNYEQKKESRPDEEIYISDSDESVGNVENTDFCEILVSDSDESGFDGDVQIEHLSEFSDDVGNFQDFGGKNIEDKGKNIENKGKTIESEEKTLEKKEKTLEKKEKTLEKKEKTLEKKEKTLEKKEKTLEKKGKPIDNKGKPIENKEKTLENEIPKENGKIVDKITTNNNEKTIENNGKTIKNNEKTTSDSGTNPKNTIRTNKQSILTGKTTSDSGSITSTNHLNDTGSTTTNKIANKLPKVLLTNCSPNKNHNERFVKRRSERTKNNTTKNTVLVPPGTAMKNTEITETIDSESGISMYIIRRKKRKYCKVKNLIAARKRKRLAESTIDKSGDTESQRENEMEQNENCTNNRRFSIRLKKNQNIV